jgi:hypothetical protein
MLTGKAYPSVRHMKETSLGYAPGLTHKHKTRLERLARDKHTSFLHTVINYGRRKFYKIGLWSSLKKSQICNVQILW